MRPWEALGNISSFRSVQKAGERMCARAQAPACVLLCVCVHARAHHLCSHLIFRVMKFIENMNVCRKSRRSRQSS